MVKFRLLVGLVLMAVLTANSTAGVMMQGFYWDCPGNWYAGYMQPQAAALKNMTGGYGINRMWFPPPSKGTSGYSMGYDPVDYYDVGQYNQMGTVATKYGTQAQLKACIAAYQAQGVSCMADIVLNHRTGGQSEWNPSAGTNTWTNFDSVASGMCKWHWDRFHPCPSEWNDEGTFGGYPDVCHTTGNGVGQPYGDLKTWGNWLKNSANAGFDGWRFDYAKGYHPWMALDFRSATGSPFCVGEYWDANTTLLQNYANASGSSAFDFASYYTLKDICNNTGGGGYMPNLVDASKSFAAKDQSKAVTFIGNHDTDEITNDKMLGYAYIITYQGYPCVWWKDYFNYGLATGGGNGSGWGNGIKQLVWCRERLAGGGPSIQNLKTNDGDCLIYGDSNSGHQGYIVVINDNSSAWKGFTVTTSNNSLKNKTLKAYAWSSTVSGQNYAPNNQWCDGSGNVQVWAAPRGYAVYGPNGL